MGKALVLSDFIYLHFCLDFIWVSTQTNKKVTPEGKITVITDVLPQLWTPQ